MARVDQHGFDNQPAYLDAAGACALLGVKRQTLYAYVSRGWVRSLDGAAGANRYSREDLERLRARKDARSGHAPVAAGALRWGEPVLESALTAIAADGPRYRGHSSIELAKRGVPFESVAELLFADAPLDETRPRWPAPLPLDGVARLVPKGTPPLYALATIVPALALRDRGRFQLSPPAELDRARALLRTLAAALALGLDARRAARALRSPSIAEAAALALGARGKLATIAIEQLLVISADHELNASSFTARIAASAGADLYACVGAALQTMTGPRHGAAADRVEALLVEVGEPRRASAMLQARTRRGEALPGFGHPLYPDGDPRARRLVELSRKLPSTKKLQTLRACVQAMARAGGEPPTLDVGLVAVTAGLSLPSGAASGLFALGRAAGWIAHALEQRAANFLLRPRARYVGR